MSSSYFRITYKSKNHGYWEDVVPEDDTQRDSLYELVQRCRKEGAIPAKDSEVLGLVEALTEGDYYPPIFQEDPILTVYLEFNTVTSIGEFESPTC